MSLHIGVVYSFLLLYNILLHGIYHNLSVFLMIEVRISLTPQNSAVGNNDAVNILYIA